MPIIIDLYTFVISRTTAEGDTKQVEVLVDTEPHWNSRPLKERLYYVLTDYLYLGKEAAEYSIAQSMLKLKGLMPDDKLPKITRLHIPAYQVSGYTDDDLEPVFWHDGITAVDVVILTSELSIQIDGFSTVIN